MPRTTPLLHPLDGLAAASTASAAATTPHRDPIAVFHHPNFVGVRTEGDRVTGFVFKPPLSGFEDRPRRPLDSYGLGLDPSLTAFLDAEYEAAIAQWSRARLRREVLLNLPAAQAAWSRITAARTALEAVFEVLRETGDGQWRAQTLRLLDAQRAVLAAAKAWDETAARLAQAQDIHDGDLYLLTERLTISDIAAESGVAVDDWEIADHREYTDREWPAPVRPMLRVVTEAIDRQQEVLRAVDDLVGHFADASLPATSA